jgi:hypothetical protein
MINNKEEYRYATGKLLSEEDPEKFKALKKDLDYFEKNNHKIIK